ncbi:MAG: hypothetical protein HKP44_04235 [Desulfofustis sp.]|nr:hypothetical protein [Desulfofustis sp.]
MNRQFYEFWANFFTQVAHGQKQIEDMNTLVQKGLTSTKELNELFRRCYGLKRPETDSPEASQLWQQAIHDFQQSFNQLAGQWGWVSRSEHQEVLDRCNDLEKQARQQQELIGDLRALLHEKGLGHSELFKHINKSLKEQTDQFNALMKSINEAYKEKP